MNEALVSLNLVPDGVYIDGTFGRGGHSSAILSQLDGNGRLIALDADPDAVAYANAHLGDDARFVIHHSNFAGIADVCARENIVGNVNGVLLDLGVSSPQLDDAARGFSFSHDGPLDMRMDTSAGESAAQWLKYVDESALADVFWLYGEERYSRRIAKAVVQRRADQSFETTGDLAAVVKAAHPRWERGKHPATRVFQAIRIHVNRELESLKTALSSMVDLLVDGGRLAVISFHSLEDRLVKNFIRGEQKQAQRLRGLPIEPETTRWPLRRIGKPIRAGQAELNDNPRARSAVLRVAEKVA